MTIEPKIDPLDTESLAIWERTDKGRYDTSPRIETLARHGIYVGLWICEDDTGIFWEIDVNAMAEQGWIDDGHKRSTELRRVYRNTLADAMAIYTEEVLTRAQVSDEDSV